MGKITPNAALFLEAYAKGKNFEFQYRGSKNRVDFFDNTARIYCNLEWFEDYSVSIKKITNENISCFTYVSDNRITVRFKIKDIQIIDDKI